MLLGYVLLFSGIFVALYFFINASKNDLFKPYIFYNPLFLLIGTLLWVALIISGFILIFLRSPLVGLLTIVILILIGLFIWRKGSPEETMKVMFRTYTIMKQRYPEEDENKILCRVLKSRYPDWDDDQIKEFVDDCNDIQELSIKVLYFESRQYF